MARQGVAVSTSGDVVEGRGSGFEGLNVAVVKGVVARAPHGRLGADGTEHVSFEIRVLPPNRPSEVVPVTWPGRTLETWGFAEGDDVVVVGRVRQRFFRVAGATHCRTEVVAESVIRVRQHAAIRRALTQAAVLLTS